MKHRPGRNENFTFRCIPILYPNTCTRICFRFAPAIGLPYTKRITNPQFLRSCRRGGTVVIRKLARILDTRLYLIDNLIAIIGHKRMRHMDTNAWRALVQAQKNNGTY